RKDPAQEAKRLMAELGDLSDVTLIGHSMGGLIARAMAAEDVARSIISKVITIATPNWGSFSPVQVFTLQHGLLDKFARFVDFRHSAEDLVQNFFRHFDGLVGMLPSPQKRSSNFFDTATWPHGVPRPLKRTLVAAYNAQTALPPPDERFTQIIGVGEETIIDARPGGDGFVFSTSQDGDGTVPRDLAEMGAVARLYVRGVHMWLCNQDDVLRHVGDILSGADVVETPSVLEGLDPTPTDIVFESEATGAPRDAPPSVVMDAEARPAQRLGELLDMIHVRPRETITGRLALRSPEPDLDRIDSTGAGDGPRLRGYRMGHVSHAARAWRELSEPRLEADAHVAAGRAMQAETPDRLSRYGERLMRELRSQPVEAMRQMPKALRSAVANHDRLPSDTLESMAGPAFERIIGAAEEFLTVDFMKRGGLALNPVCRIVSLRGLRGYGTGFLVAPDVLITNNHVIDTKL
ncbi:MAG: alpha/beta fold hydrolase, partial [Pseudomonadota bacterium]